jgi:hypothetical protein
VSAKIPENVGFEVIRAVSVLSSIFWNITPCNSVKVNPDFRRNISSQYSWSKSRLRGEKKRRERERERERERRRRRRRQPVEF